MQNKPHHFFLPGFRSPRKSQGEGAVGDCLFLLEQAVFKRKKRSVLIFKIRPFPFILSPLQGSIQRFIFSLRHFSFWNYFTKSMTYFFPYIFFEVIVNFLNSQRFLPVTSAGEHRHTLLQLPLPEWGPRASGWMAMFALEGLDWGGASYPICIPLCFWGHLGKNRVWSNGLHVGMGYMTWSQRSGATLRRGPGGGPFLLWLFLDTRFEPATVTLLPSEIRWGKLGSWLAYLHTSWRLYFKWSTLRKQQTENKNLWKWWWERKEGAVEHSCHHMYSLYASKWWFNLKNECGIHFLHEHVLQKKGNKICWVTFVLCCLTESSQQLYIEDIIIPIFEVRNWGREVM